MPKNSQLLPEWRPPPLKHSFSKTQCSMKCKTYISHVKICSELAKNLETSLKKEMKRGQFLLIWQSSLHSIDVHCWTFVSSSIRIRHYSSRIQHNSLMFCIETTYEVSVEALSSIKPENVAAKKCALFQNPPLYAYLLKPRGHKIVEGNFQQVFSYDDFLSLQHMLQTG